MADEGQGCLGCFGCFPFIGGLFVAGFVGILALYALGILAAVALAAGVLMLVWSGVGLLISKRRAILTTAQQQPQPQEYGMARDPVATIKSWSMDDIAQLPPGARSAVSEVQRTLRGALKDEEFLQFTRAYPIDSKWVATDEGSQLRVQIVAVDHRWDGRPETEEQVIITFKHIPSGHRFHWPVRAFAERWTIDPEEDF